MILVKRQPNSQLSLFRSPNNCFPRCDTVEEDECTALGQYMSSNLGYDIDVGASFHDYLSFDSVPLLFFFFLFLMSLVGCMGGNVIFLSMGFVLSICMYGLLFGCRMDAMGWREMINPLLSSV